MESFSSHVVFFLFACSSTGLVFGLTLLEENLGLHPFTFTTGCVMFSLTGLLLHVNLLNYLVRKLKLFTLIIIMVMFEQIAMTLAYFPQVKAFSYIAAVLLGIANTTVYSALFFLFGCYSNFAALLGVAFAISTMLFYITVVNGYGLLVVQAFQLLMLLVFRIPNGLQLNYQKFVLAKPEPAQLVSFSVLASCFSKNILTNLYFEWSSNQLVFTFGLLFSVLSGFLLFNIKIGIFISVILAALSCGLYFVEARSAFIIAFYIANLAASGLISGAFSLNAMAKSRENNFFVYLAMTLGNCSGFFYQSSNTIKNWIFGVSLVVSLAGASGLIQRDSQPEKCASSQEKESLI